MVSNPPKTAFDVYTTHIPKIFHYNRPQSGSFRVRCMATALRLQLGSEWVVILWQRQFDVPDEVMLDQAWKITEEKA